MVDVVQKRREPHRFVPLRTFTYPLQRTGAPGRLCVRGAVCWLGFPLASPLPSIPSAAGRPAVLGDFVGTAGLSDDPCPFIVGVCP